MSTLQFVRSNITGVLLDTDTLSDITCGKKSVNLNYRIGTSSFIFKQTVSRRCPIKAIHGENGIYALNDLKPRLIFGYYTGKLYTVNNYLKYHLPPKWDHCISTHKGNIEFIIEPFDDNLLQYINDGKHGTKNNLCNVEFKECVVFGIPLVFGVTKRYIHKNEQLYADYGSRYWKLRKK